MEVEIVILGMYSCVASLTIWMFYLSDKDLREHGQELIKENERMKAEIEQYKEALDRKRYWRDKEKWILIEAEQNGVFDDDDDDDNDEFWDEIAK